MAERFVLGFSIGAAELAAFVGGRRDAAEVIDAAGGSDELDELLGEWGDNPLTGAQAIAAIATGELDPDRAYEYRRSLELIARAIGSPFGDEIEVVMTYYFPNESHGRWNPVLSALGLTELAKHWGTNNLAFPWSDGESRVEWPIATLLSPPTMETIAAELEAINDDAIAELAIDLLVDKSDDQEGAADAREELSRGLETLSSWLGAARDAGSSLLLLMDGSQ